VKVAEQHISLQYCHALSKVSSDPLEIAVVDAISNVISVIQKELAALIGMRSNFSRLKPVATHPESMKRNSQQLRAKHWNCQPGDLMVYEECMTIRSQMTSLKYYR
jgi:DNA-binding Xre family transcriptional regulator